MTDAFQAENSQMNVKENTNGNAGTFTRKI